jgi:phage protein D
MPGPGSLQLIQRPTVEADGQPQPALTANLLRMSVLENVTGLHRCQAAFQNWGTVGRGRASTTGFLYFDRALLDFGKHVAIKLPTGTIMEGAITAIGANFSAGASPELTIVAEDRFHDLRVVPRTRTFEDVSDSDILYQIASDHGLSADVDLSGPTYKIVAQLNQSDLAFLRARARLCDAELWIHGQQLHVKNRSRPAAAEPLQLNFGGSLTGFTVVADAASQPTRVSATAWDVASKAPNTGDANESVLGAQLHGGSSGAHIVATAFGERHLEVPLSPSDPRAQAETVFRTFAQRFVVGHGTAQADARIAVGAMVRVTGLGALFSGLYYVSEVNHLFDLQTGATTRFTVESPAVGQTQ